MGDIYKARLILKSLQDTFATADLETSLEAKTAIFRKALETNPTSVTLWKYTIELEECVDDAKILLSVTVEKVPDSCLYHS